MKSKDYLSLFGVTRAINNLYLYSPKNQRGSFKDISRFIEEGEIRKFKEKEDYGIKKGDIIEHKAYGRGIITEVDDEVLKIDFSNDITRSFSTKVLIENNIITILD